MDTERYLLAVKAQEAFMLLDKDKSGSLDVSELKDGLMSLGIGEETLDNLFERMLAVLDVNKNGSIDIKDFVELLTRFDYDTSLSDCVLSSSFFLSICTHTHPS